MVQAGAWVDQKAGPLAKSRSTAWDHVVQALQVEQAGLQTLIAALDGALGRAVSKAIDTILASEGRVIVTGIGKSGHIARKIAATLASTGTAALFLHPAEASHGDLGMVTRGDLVLALSWSGETVELRDTIHYAGRYRIPLLAITAAEDSALAKAATVAMIIPRADEACPHNLAPTTSTLMQLALGDAIAIALLQQRGFTPSHFQRFHPGGKLGAVLTTVRGVMRSEDDLPIVSPGATMRDVLISMSAGRLGCALVVDTGRLQGIITDGDLRRHMDNDLMSRRPTEIMTPNPRSVHPDLLATAALEMMNAGPRPIAVLPVVEKSRVVGILHMHHLVAAGLS